MLSVLMTEGLLLLSDGFRVGRRRLSVICAKLSHVLTGRQRRSLLSLVVIGYHPLHVNKWY